MHLPCLVEMLLGLALNFADHASELSVVDRLLMVIEVNLLALLLLTPFCNYEKI